MTKDMNRQLSTSRGESEKAKSKRNIENQLDKAVLKQREAEHVKALYQKIKNALSSQVRKSNLSEIKLMRIRIALTIVNSGSYVS